MHPGGWIAALLVTYKLIMANASVNCFTQSSKIRRNFLYKFILTVLTLAVTPAVSYAQGISIADLDERSSSAIDEMDELRDILGSANTDKAMRALTIVMAEGSLDQKRAALEIGLGSTSKAVQRTALSAFFDAAPIISFEFDGGALSNSYKSNFYSYFRSLGTVSGESIGRFSFGVGPRDEERQCWVWAGFPENCMLSLTDENVILYLQTVPGVGSLEQGGVVRGFATIPNSTSVPYSFVLSF